MATLATGVFPFRLQPLNNITPFTYRDGITYQELLEQLRVYVNDSMRPEFNTEMSRIIDDFQAGIENAETRIIATETEYDELMADARAYVDASVQFINNKTGQAQIQRTTLTGPYTLTVNELWPNNHPVNIVLTQDGIGGHVVTWDQTDINGTLPVATAPNAETDFWLIPEGDGSWTPVQYATKANLAAEVQTINAALGTKANAASVTTSLALKQDAATTVVTPGRYAVVAAALRNDGAGWQVIDDAGHTPLNIDSVTTDADGITVTYANLGATEVAFLAVVPDEKLGQHGFFCGASVGLTQSVIKLSQSAPTYTDYVQYVAGTGWVSTNGIFTPTFANGVLTLTHTALLNPDSVFNVFVMPRSGPTASFNARIAAESDAVDADSIKIEFRDAAGALQTANGDNMRVFVSHGGGTRTVDPTTVTTTTYPSGNLFLLGLLKV